VRCGMLEREGSEPRALVAVVSACRGSTTALQRAPWAACSGLLPHQPPSPHPAQEAPAPRTPCWESLTAQSPYAQSPSEVQQPPYWPSVGDVWWATAPGTPVWQSVAECRG